MKVIGLTGPIGAGKDEVARILRKRGAAIIDADRVAHTLYSTQSPAWHALVKAFGSKILNRGGAVNRKKLASIVFSDKSKLLELNKIVHPVLKEAIVHAVEDYRLQTTDRRPLIVINAAVLKEIGLADYVDEVWVVMASKELRLKRLIKAGLPKAEALRRINFQMAQNEYLNMADVVINNNGTIKQLRNKVEITSTTLR